MFADFWGGTLRSAKTFHNSLCKYAERKSLARKLLLPYDPEISINSKKTLFRKTRMTSVGQDLISGFLQMMWRDLTFETSRSLGRTLRNSGDMWIIDFASYWSALKFRISVWLRLFDQILLVFLFYILNENSWPPTSDVTERSTNIWSYKTDFWPEASQLGHHITTTGDVGRKSPQAS